MSEIGVLVVNNRILSTIWPRNARFNCKMSPMSLQIKVLSASDINPDLAADKG